MSRSLIPVLLLVLLGGCVEFVDPVGLRLAESTRLNVTLSLSDGPAACGEGGFAPAPGQQRVTLCVDASLFVGADRFGERLRVLSDTLWVLGTPVLPTLKPDSTRNYQFRAEIPMSQLAATELALTFPRVERAQFGVAGVRWYGVARVGPDSIARAPGEDLVLRLELPRAESNPRPGYRFWNLSVAGNPTSVAFQAFGIPQEVYRIPASTLEELGGTRFRAGLRWTQAFSSASEGAQLYVQFTEELAWRVTTVGGR